MSDSSSRHSTRLSTAKPFLAANPHHPRLALKNGSHFLILDSGGMMPGRAGDGFGLYHDDTRYLSRWNLTVDGKALTLLYSTVDDGFSGSFKYGNPSLADVPEQSVLVSRKIVVNDGVRERLRITNYHPQPVEITLNLRFAADFADMFEVRGQLRKERGVHLAKKTSRDRRQIVLGYEGLDGLPMETVIEFPTMTPDTIRRGKANFLMKLGRGETRELEIAVRTRINSQTSALKVLESNLDDAARDASSTYGEWRRNCASIHSEDSLFNRLLERGYRDLYILRQPTPKGNCLAAGIPWFSVAFGRDQAITGMQTVSFLPDLSREIINVLAKYQGRKVDPFTEERPGKIMHELRLGEMARCKEIPFIPYYGTVDATQLWLMLVGRFVDWTGELDLSLRLWPQIEQALSYLDSEVARGNGYIRYGYSGGALSNQGWKDSHDSVMYRDGYQAESPIALCEAQGYLYAAWKGMSRLARMLGQDRLSARLKRKARKLKRRFLRDFWMPDRRFVALALDGRGDQCDVVSSNPGHLLATGILPRQQAIEVSLRLMQPDMFTGWGIRTLSARELNFNPMSYHNGSVWPHDNAMIVSGFAALGDYMTAHEVMRGLLDVGELQPDLRLPELFCGFDRREARDPVQYPVSCVPQAWAAGSMLEMVSSLMGIKADAPNNRLEIARPHLPQWLGVVTITGLRMGRSRLDLRFSPADGKTTCEILRKEGDIELILDV